MESTVPLSGNDPGVSPAYGKGHTSQWEMWLSLGRIIRFFSIGVRQESFSLPPTQISPFSKDGLS